jgi:Zn-finger protein
MVIHRKLPMGKATWSCLHCAILCFEEKKSRHISDNLFVIKNEFITMRNLKRLLKIIL